MIIRDHMKLRPHVRILIWALAALIIVGILQTVAAFRRVSRGSSENLQETEAPKGNATPPASARATLPLCPAAGLSSRQSSQKTGHHSVTVTWNASAPTVNPEGKTVGYCLYRSKKKDIAKKDPKCKFCEQVNARAINVTACVDDLVENGEKYYYIARAVNAKGEPSIFSNEAPAKIPVDRGSGRPAAADSYPLCRATPGPE